MSKPSFKKDKRIFFICAHKILMQTEVPRLRYLGYEVFTPPFLSQVKDQSMVYDWQPSESTLPPDVHARLASYNFHHNVIVPEMADLLNEYFDCVIIPSAANILKEVLTVYRGKIIFRAYGLLGLLSDSLLEVGALKLLSEQENFFYVPSAAEIMSEEHLWLREFGQVVPYCLTDDVVRLANQWSLPKATRHEISLTCPNIANHYYRRHFQYLKKYFSAAHYRYYGVQVKPVTDPNIVGTIPREQQLRQFLESRGALYTHPSRTVCFLPPIEMMMLGGPVIFKEGSLLSRMMPPDAPGRAKNEAEMRAKCDRLLQGDQVFIREVIAAQKGVVDRYSPQKVWPVFDKVMQRIIDKETRPKSNFLYHSRSTPPARKRIVILMHFHSGIIRLDKGEYFSVEGIVRVMRQFVTALLRDGKYDVVITAQRQLVQHLYGYFSIPDAKSKLQVFDIRNAEPNIWDQISTYPIKHHLHSLPKNPLKKFGILFKLSAIYGIKKVMRSDFLPRLRGLFVAKFTIPKYTSILNNDPSVLAAVVPHYYAFPEASRLNKPYLLYLPDYIPHFYSGRSGFETEKKFALQGKITVQHAKLVLTNSRYSQEYLPSTILGVKESQIRCFPLPNLQEHAITEGKPDKLIKSRIMKDTRFLFYPTRDRPSKRLDTLLEIMHRLLSQEEFSDLKLVLTADLSSRNRKLMKQLKLDKSVIIFDGVSDASLSWLYRHAACLVFTSEMEGNFPTQINEALALNVPIVGSSIPLILRETPATSTNLLLARVGDADDYAEKVIRALKNRKKVISTQKKVKNEISKRSNKRVFQKNVLNLIDALVSK